MSDSYHAQVRQQLADVQAELAEARSWARHGYEIGQRHCGWTDHGVAPAWLTDGWPPHIDNCQHQAALSALPAEIAYRIRAELVCCELYGRVNDHQDLTFEQALASRDWHDLCYWGEAAARLAEGRPDGANSQSAPSSSQIRSCPDPIECGHEAALGQAEARIAAVRAALVELEAEKGYGGYGDGLWRATQRIRTAIDGTAKQPAVCCVCGSTDVVYRNYREQPFCCPCAHCCPSPADGPS